MLGYVGRLAPEKNLGFLLEAATQTLEQNKNAHFIMVGDGPAAEEMRASVRASPQRKRMHLLGSRQGQELVDAYHAMDVFCFASKSETQGMVLVEAMAAGAPVVALDASGSRDVVVDGVNGKLVKTAPSASETPMALAAATLWALANKDRLRSGARATANEFSQHSCANRALDVYRGARFSSKKVRHALSLMTRAFG